MKSFLNFLRNNVFLSVVIFASILLLILGLLLIQASQVSSVTEVSSVPESGQADAAVTNDQLLDPSMLEIPPLPAVDRNPPADLPAVQAALSDLSGGATQNTEMTDAELTKALAEAEAGSETWCDLMLVKPDADWTLDESKLFAQECI